MMPNRHTPSRCCSDRSPSPICRWLRTRGLFVLILLLYALLSLQAACAEGIVATRSEGRILADGRMAVDSRFRTELPEPLQNALKQGVPLDFALSYRLERPALAAYRDKLSRWMGDGHSVDYRLSFHPLTNRYRVSVGRFSVEYHDLDTAVKSVGATANWQVLHRHALSGSTPADVKAQIRLRLHTKNLPKPFQINAFTSDGWQLDSGWKTLTISQ